MKINSDTPAKVSSVEVREICDITSQYLACSKSTYTKKKPEIKSIGDIKILVDKKIKEVKKISSLNAVNYIVTVVTTRGTFIQVYYL